MFQMLERVQRWAETFPERIAFRPASPGSTGTPLLTYRELAGRAATLAAILRARLPQDASPVIVLGHKEPEMLVGFLAALESGHPYIPLDDSLPAQRVQHIARASGARLTLTPGHIAALCAQAGHEAGLLGRRMEPEEAFYIIFTSGSTGEPKGVIITAGCVDAFLAWMLAEHTLSEGREVFLNQAPFSFDLSVMDLYLSLATGGSLFSITRAEISDFRALYRAFSGSGLTVWVSTPSFAQLCLAERTFSAERLPALRRFLFCGETLLPETAARLLDRFPQAEVWNTYGPTEATCATTSIRVDQAVLACGGPLPIGAPRPGTAIYLFDEDGLPVPDGERGEIIIAGPNVSPGYLGQPDLTASAFFVLDGCRAYRTGDWGRRRSNGMLFFEGRRDDQIKLNGYRIELADIEANLLALPEVRDCAVAPVSRNGAIQSLTAFVALHEPLSGGADAADLLSARLRAALAERLPAYMLPRKMSLLPHLPLTANGKADRRRLAEMAAAPPSVPLPSQP